MGKWVIETSDTQLGVYFTGKVYYHQGEKFPVFTSFLDRKRAKEYKTEAGAKRGLEAIQDGTMSLVNIENLKEW